MSGRYNTWIRKALADRIEENHGYGADHTRFPIQWSVPLYTRLDSAAEAVEALVEHDQFMNEQDLRLQFPFFDEWWGCAANINGATRQTDDQMWNQMQERTCQDLSDDCGLKMWSPDTATKYGFDYEGDGADRGFVCTLENYGRGGKHVALCDFDGIVLKGKSSRDWADIIRGMDDYEHVPNQWCRKLMGMLDEWDEAFKPINVERSAMHYMTDIIARDLGMFD